MNLTLIGMPGAGKSVIGKELARRLNFRFIDPDQLMRQHLGLGLGAILARLGDEMFLSLEEEIVLRLGDFDRSIVSPGGSVVYSRKAMDFLKQRSVIVFLHVPCEVIGARVEPQRGVVGLRDRCLKDLFKERLPLYEKYADLTVGGNRDVSLVVEEIIRLVGLNIGA